MKDNLSLIYETSMEVRKALMDARIKKGSALTPEETKAIMSRKYDTPSQELSYAYYLDVSVARVKNTIPGTIFIDLKTIDYVYGGWGFYPYLSGIGQSLTSFVPILAREMVTNAFDVLKRKNYLYYSRIPSKHFILNQDFFNWSCWDRQYKNSLDKKQVGLIPPHIYVNGMCDRIQHLGQGLDGCMMLFRGYAYVKSNNDAEEYRLKTESQDRLISRKKTRSKAEKNYSFIERLNNAMEVNAPDSDYKLDIHADYAMYDEWLEFVSKYGSYI